MTERLAVRCGLALLRADHVARAWAGHLARRLPVRWRREAMAVVDRWGRIASRTSLRLARHSRGGGRATGGGRG